MSAEPLLKVRDVARLLGLEMATVLDHFEAGDLPGFRLYGRKGGPVRFRESEIEAWLDGCRHGVRSPDLVNGRQRSHAPAATPEDKSDARRILRPV